MCREASGDSRNIWKSLRWWAPLSSESSLHPCHGFMPVLALSSSAVSPRTVAHQAPLSMGFFQAGILEWIAFPPPWDLPSPGIKPTSPAFPALQEDSLPLGRHESWASPVAQLVNSLPAMQENRVQSLGWEDPLEKEMATHSSILAWRNPWTEEPGGLQNMGSQRVGHDWGTNTRYVIQLLRVSVTTRGCLILVSRLVIRTSPPFKVVQFTRKTKRRQEKKTQSKTEPSYCSPSHIRIFL